MSLSYKLAICNTDTIKQLPRSIEQKNRRTVNLKDEQTEKKSYQWCVLFRKDTHGYLIKTHTCLIVHLIVT